MSTEQAPVGALRCLFEFLHTLTAKGPDALEFLLPVRRMTRCNALWLGMSQFGHEGVLAAVGSAVSRW